MQDVALATGSDRPAAFFNVRSRRFWQQHGAGASKQCLKTASASLWLPEPDGWETINSEPHTVNLTLAPDTVDKRGATQRLLPILIQYFHIMAVLVHNVLENDGLE